MKRVQLKTSRKEIRKTEGKKFTNKGRDVMEKEIRFNLICEDGCIYKNSLLSCSRGRINSYRDLHNALKWEKQILIEEGSKKLVLHSKDYYDAEIIN